MNAKPPFNIGVIEGEGIGKEIIPIAIECMKVIASQYEVPLNFEFYSNENLFEFYHNIKNKSGVILRGPLNGKLTYEERQKFNLYYKLVEINPIPEFFKFNLLKRKYYLLKEIDLLIVRELNKGMYYGTINNIKENRKNFAICTIKYDEDEIKKIGQVAFKFSRLRKRRVSLFIKKDLLGEIGEMWVSVLKDLSKENKDISFEWINPDLGIVELLRKPDKFDVVIVLNAEGDLMSDLLAQIVYGSRNICCSCNFNNDGFAVFQTLHGGAEDIAGRNIANPIGQIMAGAMLLEYSVGVKGAMFKIKKVVGELINAGYCTKDITLSCRKYLGTKELGQLILKKLWSY